MEYLKNKKKNRIIINKIKYDYFFEMYFTNKEEVIINDRYKMVVFLRKKLFGYSREITTFYPINLTLRINLYKSLNKNYSEEIKSKIGDEKLLLLYDSLEDKYHSNEELITYIDTISIMEILGGK